MHAVLVGSDRSFFFGGLQVGNAANVCTDSSNLLSCIFASEDLDELVLPDSSMTDDSHSHRTHFEGYLQ